MPAIYDTYEDYQEAVIRSADRLIDQYGGFGEATAGVIALIEKGENDWLLPVLEDVMCEVCSQEQSDWEERTCVDSFSSPARDIDEIRRETRGRRSA